MRFLVHECTRPSVARWLIEQGHDVYSVYNSYRGLDDETILQKAFDEKRILITNDKDFGERVYRQKAPHHGVIFLRLQDERTVNKIETLKKLFNKYESHLEGNFVIATEKQVRFARQA